MLTNAVPSLQDTAPSPYLRVGFFSGGCYRGRGFREMVELFFSLNNDENTKVIMLGRRGVLGPFDSLGEGGSPYSASYQFKV